MYFSSYLDKELASGMELGQSVCVVELPLDVDEAFLDLRSHSKAKKPQFNFC